MAKNPLPPQIKLCADLLLGVSQGSSPFPRATRQHLAALLGDGKDAIPDQLHEEISREGKTK